MGYGPEDSPVIDLQEGAPQADIRNYYWEAIERRIIRDKIERELSKQVVKGRELTAELEDEIEERYRYWRPSKISRMRYHSFVVYFGLLKRLGWVDEVKEEPSGPGEYHEMFHPRRYYRLTETGKSATSEQLRDPIMTLYNYPREVRSGKKYRYTPEP